MGKSTTTRTILSAEAKARLAQMVDDVYAHGTRYIIQRFDAPRAVLISLEDYQRLLAADTLDVRTLREARSSYNLGRERTAEEIAALLDGMARVADDTASRT